MVVNLTLKKTMKKGKKRLVMNLPNRCLFVLRVAYHWMPGRKGMSKVTMPKSRLGSVVQLYVSVVEEAFPSS